MSAAQPFSLKESIEYQNDSVVSKTLIKKDEGTLTLFAFARGQGLSEHTAPFDACVQIIEGAAQITVGGEEHRVEQGHMLIMPANVPHALQAQEPFKMLLTMIKKAA
jgi:quercetin dioxygenase-like cupin family protein